MPDYSKGQIYRIVCNLTNTQYVGSTVQGLAKRLGQHVQDAKNNRNQCKSQQIIQRGDYAIVLIENFPCNSKQELERRERFHIESMDCVNRVVPTRTHAEWIQDNREHYNEHQRKYREMHREKYVERERQYYQIHKDQRNEYKRRYNQINKEKVAEQKRLYYQQHKDQYNEYNRQYRARKRAQHTAEYRALQNASANELISEIQQTPPEVL